VKTFCIQEFQLGLKMKAVRLLKVPAIV